MAVAYKVLGQSAAAATTLTTLYTVPGSTSTVVSSVTACNRGATTATIRLSAAIAGAADATSQYYVYDYPVAANDTLSIVVGICLAATDLLRVYTDLAQVTFTAFGSEIT
jgi:hypothetical protein